MLLLLLLVLLLTLLLMVMMLLSLECLSCTLRTVDTGRDMLIMVLELLFLPRCAAASADDVDNNERVSSPSP